MIQNLIDQGLSLIRLRDDKKPIGLWGEYQKQRVTEASFFEDDNIGVVCGEISGNLLVIDVDIKYDLTYNLYNELIDLINTTDETIIPKICINRTKNGGYHLIFRCEKKPIGNIKLASRLATEEEQIKGDKVKCLIETRGEGGYICHPPMKGYTHLSGKINILTEDQVSIILDCCKSFNQIESPVKEYKLELSNKNNYLTSPFQDYDDRGDCISELKKHGWIEVFSRHDRIFFKRPGETSAKTSANYHIEKKRLKVFSSSTVFDSSDGIAYSPSGVYTILNHNGDHKASARDLISKGYGKQQNKLNPKFENDVIKLRRNGYSNEFIIPQLMKSHNLPQKEIEENLKLYDENKGKEVLRFWSSELKKDGTNKIDIIRYDFFRFLTSELNIYRYKLAKDSQGYKFIRVNKNIISIIDLSKIKTLVMEYLEKLDLVFDGVYRDALIEVMLRQSNLIFSDNILDFMELGEFNILRSTKDKCYFPFKNGIVEVSKDLGIQLVKYEDMGDYFIFENNIIDHDFIVDNAFNGLKFLDFISKINSDAPERIRYCQQLIGYLLHDFRDPLRPYSIVFGEEAADSRQGGGAGKGILVEAIGFLQKSVTIDGKSFDPDKEFAFQRVNIDTKIVLLQDTLEIFNFEKLFVKATDGFSVRKLFTPEIFIPYSDSPKFLITTNYTVDTSMIASKRRLKLLEFSGFFGSEVTPYDYLGERMFSDWNSETWNKFFNWMLKCAYTYLNDGIVDIKESHTSLVKRIATKYTNDFLTWFNSYELNELKYFSDVYEDFLKANGLNEKGYSRKRFSSALDFACESFNYKYTRITDPISKNLKIYWGHDVKTINELTEEVSLF